ncbi:MAG: hypothetical protein ACREBV_03300, partial [Candidatus Zixiibacteriota bacterium]
MKQKNFKFIIISGLLLAASTYSQDSADTTKAATDTTTSLEKTEKPPEHFVPVPDRWRSIVPPPYELYVKSKTKNPYYQNPLKGDYPIWGQNTFLILTGTVESFAEVSQVPTPSGVSTSDPISQKFFGEGERFAMLGNLKFTFELYHGQTAFRPRDWEIKVTPVFNLNYVNLKENNGVNINPRKGDNRSDKHVAFQELAIEKKLFDMTSRYDFMSIRAGIQRFGSDFRAFIFNDNNLGIRLFGNFNNNKYQYNFIYLPMLEKETNSELNTVFEEREQDVFIANLYKQDFGVLGYTAQLSFHFNKDKASTHYDENGRPVRPAPIGLIREHQINAYYLGWAGDGHFGRINVTHALYHVFGDDDYNQIAGRKIDINAQMVALEVSIDKDWMRFKASGFYASGDADPLDDRGKGFDAIIDQPFFAGGPFSYWQQQGIGLPGVALVHKFSFLPSLRTNKLEGQANFINPGLFLLNAGYDAELTPKLKMLLNANLLRFATTKTLEHFLNQPNINKNIGMDYSLG